MGLAHSLARLPSVRTQLKNHRRRFFALLVYPKLMTTSSRIIPSEPNAPQIFFGRDAELSQIVHTIFADLPSRLAHIAILGPGGYGKTTLANAVLTHERIQEHFGDARYFVNCESIFSSEALITELGKTLGVFDGAPGALWSRIRTVLSARESILCLDNFESPWDQSDDIKLSVEELLSRITSLHHATVLITMRGAERPARTQWSHPFLEPLNTFDQVAAKEVWQAIAGNYDEFSEKLITVVNCVPLAVDLLAHLAQMMSPMLLWDEWNDKQTEVVQTGHMNRLTNLEYSIQLSIDSGRMKANPTAKVLLGVLSMLPDGLHIKLIKEFQSLLVDVNIVSCLQTLQQCSLTKLYEERYQLHPIVRHFYKTKGALSLKHKAIVENFYITWASLDYDNLSEAYTKMVLEVNNIQAVLLSLLESSYKTHFKLISASINLTWFQIHIGNHSDKVINQAVQFIQRNHGDIALHIRSLTTWGVVFAETRNIENAMEKLKGAEQMCISSKNIDSDICGEVYRQLGRVYLLQDKLNDAMAYFQRALQVYGSNFFGCADVYDRLGGIYTRLGQLDEAFKSFQNALECIEQIHDNRFKGNVFQGLEEIYIRQNRLDNAEVALQNALVSYLTVHSLIG